MTAGYRPPPARKSKGQGSTQCMENSHLGRKKGQKFCQLFVS